MEKGGIMYICFHFMKCQFLEKGYLTYNPVMDLLYIFYVMKCCAIEKGSLMNNFIMDQ